MDARKSKELLARRTPFSGWQVLLHTRQGRAPGVRSTRKRRFFTPAHVPSHGDGRWTTEQAMAGTLGLQRPAKFSRSEMAVGAWHPNRLSGERPASSPRWRSR